MAYDEVGGCRRCGFFHGECPILETGRQSHAKAKEQKSAVYRDSMRILRLCLRFGDNTSLPRKVNLFLGFIYGRSRNARQSV